MTRTLEEILKRISADVDLDTTLPTGEELLVRVNYINQAIDDAVDTIQLSELKEEYLVDVSTLSTIPLPNNFRELQQHPRLYSGGSWITYEEIEAEEKYEHSAGEKYCYVMGNNIDGYNLIFNNLTANATLSVIYQKYPTELTTLTDKTEIPDINYLVKKAESYIFASRGDDRYNIAIADADRRLLNMTGRASKTSGGQRRTTKSNFVNPLS